MEVVFGMFLGAILSLSITVHIFENWVLDSCIDKGQFTLDTHVVTCSVGVREANEED